MEKLIRTIKKSQRQELRVGLSEYTKDGTTFNMAFARVYYDDGAKHQPSRNGLNLRVELLPELIAALCQAEAEAKAAGLLKEPEAGSPVAIATTEAAPDSADEAGLAIIAAG